MDDATTRPEFRVLNGTASVSPFLTVPEAAQVLGVTERKAYDLLKLRDPQTGRPVVPHVRQGESYVLHRGELLTFLERGRAGLWDATSPGQMRPDAVERLAEEVLDRVLELIVQAKRQGRR